MLNIETRADGDTLNVKLTGDFDMGAVPDFRQTLEETHGTWRLLAIDLSDVPFMDSSGLQELLRLRNRAQEEEREVVLVRPSAPVVRLLELTGLDTHFTIHN